MFLEKMDTDEKPADLQKIIRAFNRKINRQNIKINNLKKKQNESYLKFFKLRERIRSSNKREIDV